MGTVRYRLAAIVRAIVNIPISLLISLLCGLVWLTSFLIAGVGWVFMKSARGIEGFCMTLESWRVRFDKRMQAWQTRA